MNEWMGMILDAILILVVGAGVVQASRLIAQLRDLRAGRAEMERFVRDFNGAVMRAEAGIKGLRAAARESGDDLEKLVEKGVMIRDELNFIVESADGVAERLSAAASGAMHIERVVQPKEASEEKTETKADASAEMKPPLSGVVSKGTKPDASGVALLGAKPEPASRAEKELLQALKKLS